MLVLVNEKGGIWMLSAKELMQLEDFLTMEQSNIKTLNQFANQLQDSQSKQLFQQMAQKNQQHVQTISKHLTAGQTLQ
jgi:rubrerythrin